MSIQRTRLGGKVKKQPVSVRLIRNEYGHKVLVKSITYSKATHSYHVSINVNGKLLYITYPITSTNKLGFGEWRLPDKLYANGKYIHNPVLLYSNKIEIINGMLLDEERRVVKLILLSHNETMQYIVPEDFDI